MQKNNFRTFLENSLKREGLVFERGSAFREEPEKNAKFSKMAGVSNPTVEHDAKTRGIILHIVEQIKSQGVFDRFRRDCLEELDGKVGTRIK